MGRFPNKFDSVLVMMSQNALFKMIPSSSSFGYASAKDILKSFLSWSFKKVDERWWMDGPKSFFF